MSSGLATMIATATAPYKTYIILYKPCKIQIQEKVNFINQGVFLHGFWKKIPLEYILTNDKNVSLISRAHNSKSISQPTMI